MQPWKISVGLDGHPLRRGLDARRPGIFMDSDPTFGWSSPISGILVSWYAGLALAALMFSIYSGARLMGLADSGPESGSDGEVHKTRGGRAVLSLPRRLEQEERGEYPGA